MSDDPNKSYDIHGRDGHCDKCGMVADAGTVCVPPTTDTEVREQWGRRLKRPNL